MERTISSGEEVLIIRLDDRTVLRTAQERDAEELFAAIQRNSARLNRWLAWHSLSYSLNDTKEFLAHRVGEAAAGDGLTMLIRRDGAISGAIALHQINRRHKSTSVGYWIDQSLEGTGVATAACRAVVTHGFHAMRLHRIEIRCATWNHKSSGIPRRLGFLEEGILREAEFIGDRYVDLRVFGMLAQDWPA